MTVDSHTEGEPTRVVIAGIPKILGRTMLEKKKFLEEHYSSLRKVLMREPRGHREMVGAVLTEPVQEESSLGVVFMNNRNYYDMCGHGTIGVATTVLELGMVDRKEPITELKFDTPIGQVLVKAEIREDSVESITFQNQPCFLYQKDIELNIPPFGKLHADIVFGGNWFTLMNKEEIGLELSRNNLSKFLNLAIAIREIVNSKVELNHPESGLKGEVDHMLFYGPPSNPQAHGKGIIVAGEGSVDRSPCGTGTSARMALLYAQGKLKLQEEFIHEGILGTRFYGRLVREVKVGHLTGVIPEIRGNAYVTGIHQFMIDQQDSLREGFLL
jgi:proline racemase